MPKMSLRRDEFGEDTGVATFDLLSAGGSKRRIVLRVGKPYCISPQEWACPVELQGFEPRHPDIRGQTSLQALCLAINLVRLRLKDFVKKGGKLLDTTDGSEWSLRDLAATFGEIGSESDDAG